MNERTASLPMPGVRARNTMQRRVFAGAPDECWPWTGRRDEKGYGFIKVWGATTRAHRVAWAIANDRWPPVGLLVCHRCDNPHCCNPSHLVLGTPSQNMRDRNRSGRIARGEACGSSKLTATQVEDARSRVAAGESHGSVARSYNVTRQCISAIINGRNWRATAGAA